MDHAQIKQDFASWLENFVTVPNPKLGNWPPCPYAKQAWMQNKVKLLFNEDNNLENSVVQALPLLDTKEVVIVCFDHTKISGTDLQKLVVDINKKIMPKYVILEDHPDIHEEINGVVMNFGKCGLLVISELSKLNQASDQLKKTTYYDVWTPEQIDDVVSWRYEK